MSIFWSEHLEETDQKGYDLRFLLQDKNFCGMHPMFEGPVTDLFPRSFPNAPELHFGWILDRFGLHFGIFPMIL